MPPPAAEDGTPPAVCGAPIAAPPAAAAAAAAAACFCKTEARQQHVFVMSESSTRRCGDFGNHTHLDGQEELELRGKLVFAIEPIGEVDTADAAVCVDLNSQRLDVVGAVSASGEVTEVELDLVPAVVKAHWHCADKWLHSGRRLEHRSIGVTVDRARS